MPLSTFTPHLLDQVGVSPAAGNELLEMLDVVLLLLVLLHLHDLVLGHRLDKGVVVTRVVVELLMGQPDDVGTDSIEEVLQSHGGHAGSHKCGSGAAASPQIPKVLHGLI